MKFSDAPLFRTGMIVASPSRPPKQALSPAFFPGTGMSLVAVVWSLGTGGGSARAEAPSGKPAELAEPRPVEPARP